jgi:hypothetical protein
VNACQYDVLVVVVVVVDGGGGGGLDYNGGTRAANVGVRSCQHASRVDIVPLQLASCNLATQHMHRHSHVISLADAALVLGPVNRSALGLAAAARVRISHSDATTGDWCLASEKAHEASHSAWVV